MEDILVLDVGVVFLAAINGAIVGVAIWLLLIIRANLQHTD